MFLPLNLHVSMPPAMYMIYMKMSLFRLGGIIVYTVFPHMAIFMVLKWLAVKALDKGYLSTTDLPVSYV